MTHRHHKDVFIDVYNVQGTRTIRQSVLDGYIILIILNVRLLRTSGNTHCLLFCTAPMSVYGCLCGGNNVIICTSSKTFVKSH